MTVQPAPHLNARAMGPGRPAPGPVGPAAGSRRAPTTDPEPPRKNWTVLVWSASDNDLYAYQLGDLDEMERVGSNDEFNLVAQVDHRPNPDPNGPHTVQRLELAHDLNPGLASPVKADLGDANMADAQALADFIEWGMKAYPAEHYWLVVSDHGEGWRGACQDDGSEQWMSLPALGQGLKLAREATGRKLDVLSFDCCYMGSAEVAHQLKDEARYMAGSQEAMGYYGLPYEEVLAGQGLQPQDVVQRLVKLASQTPRGEVPTYSVVDLERVPAVTEAVGKLSQAILDSPRSGEELRAIAQGAQSFDQFRDLYDLADRFGTTAGDDAALTTASQAVKSAVDRAVLAEFHDDDYPGAHGLQVGFDLHSSDPEDKEWVTWEEGYADLAFARDTGWGAAVEKMRA